MDSASIAAKRYRQFKAEKHKESVKKDFVSFLIKLFEMIIKALQKGRIVKKRQAEIVTVE
jgi:hypothetical protein